MPNLFIQIQAEDQPRRGSLKTGNYLKGPTINLMPWFKHMLMFEPGHFFLDIKGKKLVFIANDND